MGVMEGMKELLNYFVSSKEEVLSLLIEHIELTVLALLAAILIGVPLGILISYIRPASRCWPSPTLFRQCQAWRC
jgi:osmoprotectant transport system permease protein